MNPSLHEWKRTADRLWSMPVFDHFLAVRLVAEVARASTDAPWRDQAAQALPSLRAACAGDADPMTKQISRRRFGCVRDALHAITGPQFGRRLSPNEMHRRALGLPLDKQLDRTVLDKAFKQAAKTKHPDGGGDEQSFRALCAARDALLEEISDE
jgi:hypothetical protein